MGNARDRRRVRRAKMLAEGLLPRKVEKVAAPVILKMPPKFQPGDLARITVEDYGVRYKGQKVTILGDVSTVAGKGHWEVRSPKRKASLVIHEDHLEKVEVKKAA